MLELEGASWVRVVVSSKSPFHTKESMELLYTRRIYTESYLFHKFLEAHSELSQTFKVDHL